MHCYFKCINFPPTFFISFQVTFTTLQYTFGGTGTPHQRTQYPIYRDFGRTIYWSCISGCQVWSKSTGVMIRLHVSLNSILQHLSEIIASHRTDTIQSSAPPSTIGSGTVGLEVRVSLCRCMSALNQSHFGCRMMESGPVIGSPL